MRGAFTGADADRKGCFELAHQGTSFLDEIGDMPLELQAKLLRVLEDGVVTPVGGSESRRAEVRVLAATNADLQARIADHTFRQDLYFRLARYVVAVPPLRQRREDIPLLAGHFIGMFAREMGMGVPRLSAEALSLLGEYDFPGNVRELKNIIERALIESGGEEIRLEHIHFFQGLPSPLSAGVLPVAQATELPLNLAQTERILVKRALEETRAQYRRRCPSAGHQPPAYLPGAGTRKREELMEYQILRGTGIKVSRVCLGTMTFGEQASEAVAQRMVDRSLEAGVNFIDVADAYVGGKSEEILGRALKGRRHRVVLASKVRWMSGDDPHKDQGLHRWHVIRGLEASLKRLQTDCLDICYLHAPDYQTPIEETLAAFDLLVQQGKVVYVGMSNYAAWQMCEALWKCDRRNWAPPVVMQVVYNLVARSLEAECLAFAKKMNLGMVVYNPLAGGLLTGKHRQAQGPEAGTRFAMKKTYYDRYWSPGHFAAVEELAKVAAQAGKSLTQLSLQWLLSQSHVDSVIIGVSKELQLEENLRFAEGRLDEETLKACDAVWQRLSGEHFAYNR